MIRHLALSALALAYCIVPAVPATAAPASDHRAPELTQRALSALQLPFIANAGQADARVGFYAHTFAGTVYVTRGGELVYDLPATEHKPGWTLTEKFQDGKANPIGQQISPTRVSFFLGPQQSRTGNAAATFETLSLGEVYPGVAVSLRAYGDNVEKIYTVQPNGSADRIRMRFEGAQAMHVEPDGSLVIGTGNGDIRQSAPVAYQEKDGQRLPVTVAYTVQDRQYGYRLGAHDPKLPVVIDPLLQATYLGGNGTDRARSIAVHPHTGDIYIAGQVGIAGAGFKTSFPGLSGGYQASQPITKNAGSFGVIARLSADLKTLKQATYFGSGDASTRTRNSDIQQIIIHPGNGDVYILGEAGSNLPGLTGAAYTATALGLFHNFVSRFSADLKTLVQSTHLYESSIIFRSSRIAAHPINGSIYVAGTVGSSQHYPTLPGSSGGYQEQRNFDGASFADGAIPRDAFVMRLSEDLKTIQRSTFLGGTHHESGEDIAIHPASGEIYVTGSTKSTDFPGTTNGAQTVQGSQPSTGLSNDAFIARLSEGLDRLNGATYLGGSLEDEGHSIAFDQSGGSLYLMGSTKSKTFPKLAAGDELSGSSDGDLYAARFSPDLRVLYTTRVAGIRGNILSATVVEKVRVHQNGETYVFGPYRDLPGSPGRSEAGFAHFSSDLGTVLEQTYLTPESRQGVGVDFAISPITGSIYVTGNQEIDKAFPSTTGGFQPIPASVSGGKPDTFIALYSEDISSDTEPDNFVFTPQSGVPLSTSITSNTVTITGINVPATISVSGGAYSIGCTGAFTNETGSIGNGQTVCVNHTSSALFTTLTETVLTVGKLSVPFQSLTISGPHFGTPVPPGDTPSGLPSQFKSKKRVKALARVTSGKLKIKGLSGPTPISISNGEYSLGCKKRKFTASPGVIRDKQTVCVRHRAASQRATENTTTLYVGGWPIAFTSKTR